MVLSITDKDEKWVVIKLADVVTEADGLKFLHSLDYENLYSACLCEDDGKIIYQIKDNS